MKYTSLCTQEGQAVAVESNWAPANYPAHEYQAAAGSWGGDT